MDISYLSYWVEIEEQQFNLLRIETNLYGVYFMLFLVKEDL